jgi:DNA-binding NarL/FixJ family response regulator
MLSETTTLDQLAPAVAPVGRHRPPRNGDGSLTVMVVDDHPVFAEALALAINASGQMSCVAIAPDADEAQRLAGETEPDVIVMDVGLDGTDGIAATRSLRERHPDTRVLVLTGQPPTAPLVHAAAEAGASALLSKVASLNVVVETISSLTDDCFTLDRRTVDVLCAPALSGQVARTRPAAALLTRREQDILGLLVSGVDLQTASVRLGITVNTARGYVKNLYRKLGVHNQLELLAVAREKGLLEPTG